MLEPWIECLQPKSKHIGIYLQLLWLECMCKRTECYWLWLISLFNLSTCYVYFCLSAAACALADNIILQPPQQRGADSSIVLAAGDAIVATRGLVVETGTTGDVWCWESSGSSIFDSNSFSYLLGVLWKKISGFFYISHLGFKRSLEVMQMGHGKRFIFFSWK